MFRLGEANSWYASLSLLMKRYNMIIKELFQPKVIRQILFKNSNNEETLKKNIDQKFRGQLFLCNHFTVDVLAGLVSKGH